MGALRAVRAAVAVGMIVVLASGQTACPVAAQVPPDFDSTWDIWPTAVAPAQCRPGDRVETGLQGTQTVEHRL